MADLLELHQVLGKAYAAAQLHGDRGGAVKDLRSWLAADPSNRLVASVYRDQAATVVRARSAPGGGQTACHVTRFAHDILTDALEAS